MSPLWRSPYFLLVLGLHAAVLWGVTIAQPRSASESVAEFSFPEILSDGGDTPESDPGPIAPEVPQPATPMPETAVPTPVETPPAPAVQEVFIPAPAPIFASVAPSKSAAPSRSQKSARAVASGRGGSGGGRGGAGDRAHADWRNRVLPTYPANARTARQTGRVMVTVEVSSLGSPLNARVASSSGVPSLDEAALAAARASTYYPRIVDGVAMADTVTVPYTFRLEGR